MKCLNLNDSQFKTSRYSYRSSYMNPMITTNQKPTIDTQKLERKENKQTNKENHQTTREGTIKGRKEQRTRKELENK